VRHPNAIGVFDSGVGGLSVLRHIRAQLPRLPLLYVADSGHVPYGDKTADYIRERSLALTEFLVAQGAAAVVVACNTATAAAAALLRERFEIPIIAMEPAVKPAVTATRSGVVGVLATVGTLESARFAALLEQYAGDVEIVTQACPGLVEQVEAGELATAATRELVARYTKPLLERGADTLVLGCTHYPFLRPLIAELVGREVQLIDTGEAVARQVVRRLPEKLLGRGDTTAVEHFWTSGDARSARGIVGQLWGQAVAVSALQL
jgi:glutamate racemase